MNFLKMLKACLHPAVIIGAVVVIALTYLFAPQLVQYSWVLVVLVCPLSMILMMAMMSNKKHKKDHEKTDANNDTKV